MYAAYGSNMNIKQMEKRCPRAKIYGVGKLHDYSLVFRGKGHANIEKAKGKEVPIVLWQITPTCEEELDKYEEYPHYYIKENIVVSREDELYECLVYVMGLDYKNKRISPANDYVETIREGYRDNQIDLGCLNKALEEIDEIEKIK